MRANEPNLLQRLLRRLGVARFDAAALARAAGAKVVAGPNWSYAIGFPTRNEAELFAAECRRQGFEAEAAHPESQTADVLFRTAGRPVSPA